MRLFSSFIFLLLSSSLAQAQVADFATFARQQLAGSGTVSIEGIDIEKGRVRSFYEGIQYQSVFTNQSGLTGRFFELRRLQENLVFYGLDPRSYWSREIERVSLRNDRTSLNRTELLAAQIFLNIAADLNTGRLSPEVIA